MTMLSIHNIKLAGIAAAVPAHRESNADLPIFTEKQYRKFERTVGISERRIAPVHLTAGDLCEAAARRLLDDMQVDPMEIGAVLMVTQTPDHLIPGTATQIQHRLGIPPSSFALDLNAGCAGYVQGLATLSSLQSSARRKYALLLVGDTITRHIGPEDQATRPIFSDAGSATLLQHIAQAAPMHFQLASDGGNYQAIHLPNSGARASESPESTLQMAGLEVFEFALTRVIPQIETLCARTETDLQQLDHFIFHQANLLLNESLRRKLNLAADKMPMSLSRYGNTSCATIPVTIVDQLREELTGNTKKILLSGFGVGLSWASAILEAGKLTIPPMLEVE